MLWEAKSKDQFALHADQCSLGLDYRTTDYVGLLDNQGTLISIRVKI